MWREAGPRTSAIPVRDLFDAAAHGYNLKLACPGCGRAQVLNRFAIWWLFRRRGWRDRLADVPARFRCAECGRKRPSLDLVHAEPTAHSLAAPSEREWKQELRRRR